MMPNNKTQLASWALYDWASSSFSAIITTFVFATYFTSHVAQNEIIGTYQWASASAVAGIIIAIFSPIFGAIADHGGHHKRWLLGFTLICSIFTALLWFVYPTFSSVHLALTFFVIGTICLEIAFVFYNSFLQNIAPQKYIGRISGWAWGLGYIGGIAALSVMLFGFIKNPPSWMNTQLAEQVRICGPFVAIWFLLFSLPLFIFVPDTPSSGLTAISAIKTGLRELKSTLSNLPRQKNLVLFLIAHMIYVDGLNTLFAFGGIYASDTFGMDLSQVIVFGITMNIFAGIGAILLAWADDFIGSKPTILMSLICLIGFGISLLFVQSQTVFWVLALILSIFIGPVQAASRSLIARMTPPEKSTQIFGFYAFSGKVTSFFGPWLLGLATYYFSSQRAGMATIILFFVVGGLLMCGVKERSGLE